MGPAPGDTSWSGLYWALLIMETLFSFAGGWFKGDHRSNFDQSDTREALLEVGWGGFWEKFSSLIKSEVHEKNLSSFWPLNLAYCEDNLKPQQSSCVTNGQDSQLFAAQRTLTCFLFQASLWHPENSTGSISLSSWTLQLCEHTHQMSSMQLKLGKGSKLARLGNITGKVWWGENMWKDR